MDNVVCREGQFVRVVACNSYSTVLAEPKYMKERRVGAEGLIISVGGATEAVYWVRQGLHSLAPYRKNELHLIGELVEEKEEDETTLDPNGLPIPNTSLMPDMTQKIWGNLTPDDRKERMLRLLEGLSSWMPRV